MKRNRAFTLWTEDVQTVSNDGIHNYGHLEGLMMWRQPMWGGAIKVYGLTGAFAMGRRDA